MPWSGRTPKSNRITSCQIKAITAELCGVSPPMVPLGGEPEGGILSLNTLISRHIRALHDRRSRYVNSDARSREKSVSDSGGRARYAPAAVPVRPDQRPALQQAAGW